MAAYVRNRKRRSRVASSGPRNDLFGTSKGSVMIPKRPLKLRPKFREAVVKKAVRRGVE